MCQPWLSILCSQRIVLNNQVSNFILQTNSNEVLKIGSCVSISNCQIETPHESNETKYFDLMVVYLASKYFQMGISTLISVLPNSTNFKLPW